MRNVTTNQPVDQSLRTLIVDSATYPPERQRQECAPFGRGQEFASFDDWAGSMARDSDSLLVASLRLLVPPTRRGPKGKQRNPSRVFAARIAQATATGGVVIEATSGARSDDRKRWPKAIAATHQWIRSGRQGGVRAKKAGAAGGAVIKARSLAQRWEKMPKLLTKYRALWRSGELGNDREAKDAINDMLIEEGHGGMVFGSPETARRVFGNKTK